VIDLTKVLVVVESPAKAKTISKFLGRNYTVRASMGHVRDLPKSQFGVDVENDFSIKYITIRGKGELLQELKNTASKSDRILLATDPDREGEAIAWHLQHVLKIPEDAKCRIEFNEITKKAVTEAVKKPRQIDRDRVEAQQARRVLDRLVGYNLSPLLWRKIKKGLSAGRVQSVVVRLICDREEEINSFIPVEFWSVTARLNKNKTAFEAKLVKINEDKAELKNEQEVNEIIKKIGKNNLTVDSIKKRQQRRNPAPPFTTSSLQQEAARKLNFTAKKTMMIAQQLYEGLDLGKEIGLVGLITYIRTDSTRISEEAQKEAQEYILGKYGKDYLPEKPREYTTNGKIQNAHEAIRPTYVQRTPEEIKKFLSNDQYKLYKLIWDRFIASQMASALLDVTTVDLKYDNFTFRATGSILVFPGFTKVYIEGRDDSEKDENNILPPLEVGEEIKVSKIVPKQHFTQPPPRYTEATLVKTLEEKGIGRPSTYAPILDTIVTRGYAVREQKQFHPTELGCVVVDLLKKYFPEIIDEEFTAQMEEKLDSIEEGNVEWKKILLDFYQPFLQELESADKEIGRIAVVDEETEEKCEKCGRNMVIKFGRYGKFLACPGFPECQNTKPLLEETGITCPQCQQGRVVLRRSKKGKKFYGCSSYPECQYVSWDEPTAEKCPRCTSYMVKKQGKKTGERLVCSNENCKYVQTIDK
jgi:DNA topoisomerase-1